jgi:excisionase family DNA binding protein
MSRTKPAYAKSVARAPQIASGEEVRTDYVTKAIAAARLGLSVRRVLELSAQGAIKRQHVTDPLTRRRQTVFLAADIDVLAERLAQNGNYRMAIYHNGATGAGEAAALRPLQTVSAALPGPSAVLAPPDRPWLTVGEAAAYSGLPASFLLMLIAKRCLAALDVGIRPGGRYRIARRDLDGIQPPPARKFIRRTNP